MTAVLPIQGNNLRLSVQGRTVLDVPDISVGTAACTAIIGPNGAGKSLLLRALGGLLTLDQGHVTWGGQPALRPLQRLRPAERERRLAVGFVSHKPALLARSALHNMVYALRARGFSGHPARQQALESLESAGLSAIVNTPAQRLSAGEQQRLSLARALVLEPAILLLDEPTASVDPVSTAPIETMLKQASAAGCRIVIVSHDLNQVKRIADEVILMNRGSVEEQQAAQPFFETPQSQATKQWLAGELLV